MSDLQTMNMKTNEVIVKPAKASSDEDAQNIWKFN